MPTYKKTSPIGLVFHSFSFLPFPFALSQASLDEFSRKSLAEREGFEPPEPLSSTVFKTAAIDHSAISPCRNALVASNSSCELRRPPFLLLTRAHKALVIFFLSRKKCAQDETRTHTVLRPLPPQSSVYTNFTTCALCPKQDSNLHVSQHSHLKRARLPIPPFGRCVSDS